MHQRGPLLGSRFSQVTDCNWHIGAKMLRGGASILRSGTRTLRTTAQVVLPQGPDGVLRLLVCVFDIEYYEYTSH